VSSPLPNKCPNEPQCNLVCANDMADAPVDAV
jgi:hypothetical protein